jgi:hypothetical protein
VAKSEQTTVADNTPSTETVVPATEPVAQPAAQQPFTKPMPATPTVHAVPFAGDPAAYHATPAVTEDSGKDTKAEGKVYTQAQIDAMIQERVKRATDKYADYDDLKAKATDADKAKLTADEQAAQRLKDLETQTTTLAQEKAKLLVEVSFKDAASDLGLPSEAAYKLADMAQAKFDDAGRITNAKELAAAVAQQYPGLVKRGASASVVNPARGNEPVQETDAQKRYRLLGGGGGGSFWQGGGVTMPVSVGNPTGE